MELLERIKQVMSIPISGSIRCSFNSWPTEGE